jgi:hypothetical protein
VRLCTVRLGYHISVNQAQQQNNRLKMLKLGNK